jgi:putative ABC transport system ATP-binding protein
MTLEAAWRTMTGAVDDCCAGPLHGRQWKDRLMMTASDQAGRSPVSEGGISPEGRFRGRTAALAVDLVKTYGKGDAVVTALAGVDVEFESGRFTAVMGPSGSGKSTLMHCMAGLDVPTSGHAYVGDQDIALLGDAGLTELRRDHIGFVFQSFNLVPTLTARENIVLPADLAGSKVDTAWFDYVVDQLGIADRLSHRPAEMSGGQQQRCACARALIGRPDLIFADEPTGNLDSNASAEMLGFLRRCVSELGQSIVMVTHDPRGASFADRVVFLADGKVVGELASPTADTVLAQMKQWGS